MSKPRWNSGRSAIAQARLRREIQDGLKLPKPPMTKEEAFRGFIDADEDAFAEYIRQKRDERNDSGV